MTDVDELAIPAAEKWKFYGALGTAVLLVLLIAGLHLYEMQAYSWALAQLNAPPTMVQPGLFWPKLVLWGLAAVAAGLAFYWQRQVLRNQTTWQAIVRLGKAFEEDFVSEDPTFVPFMQTTPPKEYQELSVQERFAKYEAEISYILKHAPPIEQIHVLNNLLGEIAYLMVRAHRTLQTANRPEDVRRLVYLCECFGFLQKIREKHGGA